MDGKRNHKDDPSFHSSTPFTRSPPVLSTPFVRFGKAAHSGDFAPAFLRELLGPGLACAAGYFPVSEHLLRRKLAMKR